jgi:vacuolar-type H+-ATPase subunit E/Vma4
VPELGERISKELEEVDFDEEYVYLRKILIKKKDELKSTDMSGPAFRAWRLHARATKNFDDARKVAEVLKAKKRIDLVGGTNKKLTDKYIEAQFTLDSAINKAVTEQKNAQYAMDICYGLAQSFGIKKRFINKWER